MSSYAPTSDYEKQTLMHLFCVMTCEDIGDVDKRIAYSKHYIIKQYGTDPESIKIPLYYREHFNTSEHKEALDLDVWGANVYVWLMKVSRDRAFSRKIHKERNKMRKKMKKFCKTNGV